MTRLPAPMTVWPAFKVVMAPPVLNDPERITVEFAPAVFRAACKVGPGVVALESTVIAWPPEVRVAVSTMGAVVLLVLELVVALVVRDWLTISTSRTTGAVMRRACADRLRALSALFAPSGIRIRA